MSFVFVFYIFLVCVWLFSYSLKHFYLSSLTNMGKDLKHKRSISDKFKDAMHSLKQISNAVLLHNDDDNDVDDLFETLDSEDEMIDNNKSNTKSKLKLNSVSTFNYPSIESSNSLVNDSNSKKNNSNNNVNSTRTSTTSSKSLKNNTTSFSSDTLSIPNKQIDEMIDDNTRINNENNNNNNNNKQIQDNYNINPVSGPELWEEQRNQWLKPTITESEIRKRKHSHSLGNLAEYNDDVYLSVYRNLVIYNKPLKRGLNMTDGFKVIYSGWENSKMFERVANGGVP